MKEKTNKQIRDFVNGFLKGKFKAVKEEETNCEYYVGGEKHCRMTTNNHCTKCKFYAPNHSEKLRLLAIETMTVANRCDEQQTMIHGIRERLAATENEYAEYRKTHTGLSDALNVCNDAELLK